MFLQASARAPSPRGLRTAAWAFRTFDVMFLLLFDIILQRGSEFDAPPEVTLPWSPASFHPLCPAAVAGAAAPMNLAQGCVTFENVFLYFSWEKWELLEEA